MGGDGAGIVEPVPNGLERLLRRAVLDHATSESRRVFDPSVHVGVPGLVTTRFELPAELEATLDHALRVDVLEAMVRRVRRPGPPPLVWVTRRGPLDLSDADLAWLAATGTAAAELATSLPMVIVERHGWRDPRTGVGRTWRRLRQR